MNKIFFDKSFFKIIILVSATFFSCMPQTTLQKQLLCPQPVINCLPVKWGGMPYDSSLEVNKIMDYYYVFEKVNQINTPDNDWSLSFISPKKAVLMFDDGDLQRSMIIRMIKYNKGRLQSGIGIPLSGHTGALSINNKKIVMSASDINGMIGRSDLYIGSIDGNVVSNVKMLNKEIHEDEFTWESHPAFSPKGNVVFFASDRLGGIGGTDIWFTYIMQNGKWSKPINCGDEINSKCSELTPFINIDGKKILFASAGHETVGGYDIFQSEISPDFWEDINNYKFKTLSAEKSYFSKPKNLRPPLNTKGDELFPSSSVNIDSLLYYSSNQDAANASLISMEGGFDIFVRKKIVNVEEKKPVSKDIADGFIPDIDVDIPLLDAVIEIIPSYKFVGTVYNAKTKVEINEAEVSVLKIPERTIIKETTTDSQGVFVIELEKDIEYEITAQAKDLFFKTISVLVETFDTVTIIKKDLFVPEKLTLRINFPSDNYDKPYKYGLDDNGIETSQSWDMQLDRLAENIKVSLDKLKKLLLVGHTDEVGSKSYNKKLGKQRVGFVIEELVKRDIPIEILEGSSAGESKPLIQRANEDINIFRKRLRRVELQKIW